MCGKEVTTAIETLLEFTGNILMFQDVDDVLTRTDYEWLDMDAKMWQRVIEAYSLLIKLNNKPWR